MDRSVPLPTLDGFPLQTWPPAVRHRQQAYVKAGLSNLGTQWEHDKCMWNTNGNIPSGSWQSRHAAKNFRGHNLDPQVFWCVEERS